MKIAIVPSIISCLFATGAVFGEPAPAVAFNTHRAALEALLKSGDKAKIDEAYAGYRDWFSANPAEGERGVYAAKALLIALPEDAKETQELITLALAVKQKQNSKTVGYLHTLLAETLLMQNQPDAAMQTFQEGLRLDPAGTAGEALTSLAKTA